MMISLKIISVSFLFFFTSALFAPHFALADMSALAHDPPVHRIDVELYLEEGRLLGIDKICCFSADLSKLSLLVGTNTSINYVRSDGKELSFYLEDMPGARARRLAVEIPATELGAQREARSLVIGFEGSFSDLKRAREGLTRGVSYENEGVIDARGAFLPASAIWHPILSDRPALFDISVTTPTGIDAVMEGEWMSSVDKGDKRINRWRSANLLDGINIVAARFVVDEERYKGINIRTFFFAKDDKLSRLYIDKVKKYIDLYEGLLPPYPFKKFAVVESFLPTGFGMPSYTLLGSNIIRLPFIPDTSLGHEFVHNWWGNSVFVDPRYGNWAEALATFTADYRYAEAKGEGREERKKALAGFKRYAGSGSISFASFKYATDTASRAVGYNKGAMVFHMLSKLLGEEVFYAALSEFHRRYAFIPATTVDIKTTFEEVSHRELDWFFEQWFLLEGGPEIALDSVKLTGGGEGGPYRLLVTVTQLEPYYTLDLPLVIETQGGELREEMRLEGKRSTVEFSVGDRPLAVTIDPDYDIFRIISNDEPPPALATVLGNRGGGGSKASNALMVLPNDSGAARRYEPVASSLARDYGLSVVTEDEAGVIEDPALSYFIFGNSKENSFYENVVRNLPDGVTLTQESITIYGEEMSLKDKVVVVAARDAEYAGKAAVLFFGDLDEARLKRIARRIPHLTNRGFLVFDKRGGLVSGSYKWKRPLRYDLIDK